MDSATAAYYSDILPDSPYSTAISVLVDNGILFGYPDGTFRPDNSVTRAEFAAVICRALRWENELTASHTTASFIDVADSHWAANYINAAFRGGIINGTSASPPLFNPEGIVTFEQAVTMVVRALNYEDQAVLHGGWPAGYLAVGHEIGLDDSIACIPCESASRGVLSQLVFNAFFSGELIDHEERDGEESYDEESYGEESDGEDVVIASTGPAPTLTPYENTPDRIILTGIEVTAPPVMTTYYIGNSVFSSSGIVVTATYSDNSTRVVSTSCGFIGDVSGWDASSAGTKIITVSYTEGGVTQTSQFTIEVIFRELRDIRIYIEPSCVGGYNAFLIRVWAGYTDGSGNYLDPNFSGYEITWDAPHSFSVSYTESNVTRIASHTLDPAYWDWVDNVLKPLD